MNEGISRDSFFVPRIDFAFCISFCDGAVYRFLEMPRVMRRPVRQTGCLEVFPCGLDVVEFRSVSGQPLDGQPVTALLHSLGRDHARAGQGWIGTSLSSAKIRVISPALACCVIRFRRNPDMSAAASFWLTAPLDLSASTPPS